MPALPFSKWCSQSWSQEQRGPVRCTVEGLVLPLPPPLNKQSWRSGGGDRIDGATYKEWHPEIVVNDVMMSPPTVPRGPISDLINPGAGERAHTALRPLYLSMVDPML